MFALSIGVGRVQQNLPLPVYALLSGLNASTVGIIALAAVQLSESAIKDRLTRILVIFGALMGLCYTALWYFPVIMLAGGTAAVIWDEILGQPAVKILNKFHKKKSDAEALDQKDAKATVTAAGDTGESNRDINSEPKDHPSSRDEINAVEQDDLTRETRGIAKADSRSTINTTNSAVPHAVPLKIGIAIIVVFFCKLPTRPLYPSRKLIL
jgi:hypothetical protein